MAKSQITLPNGTQVTIDGSPAEIAELLKLYSTTGNNVKTPKSKAIRHTLKSSTRKTSGSDDMDSDVIIELVNSIKEADESGGIEKNILDRSSQVDRVLLPLFASQKFLGRKEGLTTGDIAKVLQELGIKVDRTNIAHTVAKSAKNYVMGDKTRKPGQAVKYVLSRKGTIYIDAVINSAK